MNVQWGSLDQRLLEKLQKGKWGKKGVETTD